MTSTLLRNGTILSWDDTASTVRVLHKSSILMVGDKITAITADADKLELPDGTEILDVTGMILTPGFINTHCHMWQTAFRSMAPDIFIAQYFGWLSQMGGAAASFAARDVYASCLEGYCEGLNAGVTSFVEHAANNWRREVVEPGWEAAVNGGARVWWCYDVNTMAGERFSAKEQQVMLREIGGKISTSEAPVAMGLAFDGFDLSTDAGADRLKEYARDVKAEVLTTHYLGGPWPVVGTTSPTEATERKLQELGCPMIFSHGGFSTEKDIQALRAHDCFLAITPENEMSEGHGQVTSQSVHDHVALGTDTNWNISGDMVLQARLWLQSVRGRNYQKTLDRGLVPSQSPMSVVDAFLLATRQGGRALHRDDIGVLKVGAKADIVCFRGDSPNMVGWTNAVAAVMLHSNVGDVEHVLVGGQFRKRDGKLTTKTGTWAKIAAEFTEVAHRIQGENKNPPPLGEKFLGIGEFGDVEVAAIEQGRG